MAGGTHASGTRGGNGQFRRTAASVARDMRAAELHGQGWTHERIAAELGFGSRGRVTEAINRAFADIVTPGAEEAKRLDLERIDRLIEQAWQVMLTPHVTVSNGKVVCQFAGFELRADGTEALDADGKRIPVFADVLDDGPRLAAVNTIKGLIERRARTFGYDAPAQSRVEVISEDAVDAELRRLDAELAARDPGHPGTS